MSPLPVPITFAVAAWGTKKYIKRNTFIGFDKKTKEGLRQSVMAVSEFDSDYTPTHEFFDNTFVDVQDGAMVYLLDPPKGWANLADCGDFPCTGPKNVLVSFQGSKFEGTKPRMSKPDFQFISNNTEISPYIDGCKVDIWQNCYVC